MLLCCFGNEAICMYWFSFIIICGFDNIMFDLGFGSRLSSGNDFVFDLV